ncbi:phosphohydrolase, partial [Methylobacterium sp. E-046]|nr:phosphohydrolase [Methylobacterium sp. E-046]
MGAILLITTDLKRGQRWARSLGSRGLCHVQDRSGDKLPPEKFALIVRDAEAFTSVAVIRPRAALAEARTEGVPSLFPARGTAGR